MRNLDADKLVARRSGDPHADQLAAARRPLEFFVDLAFDDVLITAQAVAVFEKLFDAKFGDITKRRGFFADEGFPNYDGDHNRGNGTDKESGIYL